MNGDQSQHVDPTPDDSRHTHRQEGGPHVRPAELIRADRWQFCYRQKTHPVTSNLDHLTYGTYHVASGGRSDELFHRDQETLLFCIDGLPVTVEIDTGPFELTRYDTLYIPRGTPYHLSNHAATEACLVVCRATAEHRHPTYLARWDQVRNDESRIRHLDGKDVYLMFDVTEPADRLVAGYTIYEPGTRAWPPHNHTDQEEIYVFTQGNGAMEVYADESTKTFVHSVGPLDAASIPLLNYHPVFSQDEEVHFIWCLSGARYWVGDKHKEFLDASVDKLTS